MSGATFPELGLACEHAGLGTGWGIIFDTCSRATATPMPYVFVLVFRDDHDLHHHRCIATELFSDGNLLTVLAFLILEQVRREVESKRSRPIYMQTVVLSQFMIGVFFSL